MSLTLNNRNYYYIISGLPDISIDSNKPEQLSLALKKDLYEQFHTSDYRLVELLYLHYDNDNFLNLLLKKNKPFNPLGNYTEKYLKEQITEPTNIVDYMGNFILNIKDEIYGSSNFIIEKELQVLYYEYLLQSKNKFIKEWFKFEKDIKSVLTSVNCIKHKYDIEQHIIKVKGYNEINDILFKIGPKVDLLGDELPFAADIVLIAESDRDITEKEKALDQIRWKFLEENSLFNYFTIESILSYIIKLEIVERWIRLDDEAGRILFNKFLHDIKTSYEFSEEFSLKKQVKDNSY